MLRRGPSTAPDDENPGDDLLSRAVTSAVPSALEGLTTVFGMGTGVAPPALPPGISGTRGARAPPTPWRLGDAPRFPGPPLDSAHSRLRSNSSAATRPTPSRSASRFIVVKPLGRLVPVSCTPHGASTSGLSTWSSPRGLPGLPAGRAHLQAGFALRCLQRLSLPDIATEPCPWQDSSHTRGPSTPVLSY